MSEGSSCILYAKVMLPDLRVTFDEWPWEKDFWDLDSEAYDLTETCDLFIYLMGVSATCPFFLKLTWLWVTVGLILFELLNWTIIMYIWVYPHDEQISIAWKIYNSIFTN